MSHESCVKQCSFSIASVRYSFCKERQRACVNRLMHTTVMQASDKGLLLRSMFPQHAYKRVATLMALCQCAMQASLKLHHTLTTAINMLFK